MTAPDIDQDEAVDADDAADTAGLALSDQDTELIRTSLAAASARQPTVHLLPGSEELVWAGKDGERHLLEVGGYSVILDTATGVIEPVDQEAVRQLAILRLGEVHGEGAEFPAGERTVALDYSTLQFVAEADGIATATALTLPDDTGESVQATLSIDLQWGVTLAPLSAPDSAAGEDAGGEEGTGDEGATEEAAAEEGAGDEAPTIDGNYLGSYYGDSEFPFDGRGFVISWDTWEVDQTTEDGMVGGRCTATSDGAQYELYAYFSGETGIQVVQATPTGDGDPDEEGGGITKEYLAGYYGSDRIEFEGAGIVVDWDTWEPDQTTDEGLIGSPAKGTDDDGVENDLYLWFDPAEGIQIVSAEKVGGPAEPEQVDPRLHFAEVLVPDLREHWSRTDRLLRDTSGKEYDVSAWLDGDYESEPEFEHFDGENFFLYMRMSTKDDARRVRCLLKVRDVEQITVEDEQSA
ncbi:hypothetical protein ACFPM7_29885 [Actinokineospora guangxiensis]|uniref:Uncharacterized protein n=1 Tax=Actinokineospora guangxiensis TaxID=1490288 RepID=A0ABW0EX67_9PSEU